jgi:hypothetical protein
MSQNSNQNDSEKEFFEALENFKEAVFNGQVRLALEHLVSVVDGIVDVLSSEEEEATPTPTVPEAKNENTVAPKEEPKTKKATVTAEASTSTEA